MRFKKRSQLPGAGRTRAGHHHGSRPTASFEAFLLGKLAYHTKQIRRECIPEVPGSVVFGKIRRHNLDLKYI